MLSPPYPWFCPAPLQVNWFFVAEGLSPPTLRKGAEAKAYKDAQENLGSELGWLVVGWGVRWAGFGGCERVGLAVLRSA